MHVLWKYIFGLYNRGQFLIPPSDAGLLFAILLLYICTVVNVNKHPPYSQTQKTFLRLSAFHAFFGRRLRSLRAPIPWRPRPPPPLSARPKWRPPTGRGSSWPRLRFGPILPKPSRRIWLRFLRRNPIWPSLKSRARRSGEFLSWQNTRVTKSE
jgi:hypothetical protein